MRITVLASLLLAILVASPAVQANKDRPVPLEIIVHNKPNTLQNINQSHDVVIQVDYNAAPGTIITSEGWSLDKSHHSDEEILNFFNEANTHVIFHDLWFKSSKIKPFEAGKIYHIEYFVNATVNGSSVEQTFKRVIPVTFAAAQSPIEIIQKTADSELSAVPLNKGINIAIAYKFHSKHIDIKSYQWALDHQYHSESEVHDFFEGGNVEILGTSLIIRPNKKFLLKAKTYHLYFEITATNGSNPQTLTFRKETPVTFVKPASTDPNQAVKFKLLNDEEELQRVRLDSGVTVRMEYTREGSDVIIRGEGWNLDGKFHSEKEANNFFLPNHTKIEGHDLIINAKKNGFLPGKYNLFYFVQFQIAGNDKTYEVRHSVQVNFIQSEDRVDFIVDRQIAKGMEDKVTFLIKKEGPTMLEYEVYFINPATQQRHIIVAGFADGNIDDVTFRFPVPSKRSEIVPIIFQYKYEYQNATKREISRAITVVRNTNLTLNTLKTYLETNQKEARELVSVTESIMNIAFNSGSGLKSLRDSACDEAFCSNQGTCVSFAPYYKQCKCNPAHEGTRCRFTKGEEALITDLFHLILNRLRTTGSNTATEVIQMVRRISSIPEIFNYDLIEGELSTIAIIASSVTRSPNNITQQIIPAVQSILDMLNNESFIIWDAKDEAGFKAVQAIEKRIEASLADIARKTNLDGDMFKAMTSFIHRKQEKSTLKDKLVDWLKKL